MLMLEQATFPVQIQDRRFGAALKATLRTELYQLHYGFTGGKLWYSSVIAAQKNATTTVTPDSLTRAKTYLHFGRQRGKGVNPGTWIRNLKIALFQRLY